MTVQGSTQDVPPGFMDLLRIFLFASSRGEEAILILFARKGVIGVPTAPPTYL